MRLSELLEDSFADAVGQASAAADAVEHAERRHDDVLAKWKAEKARLEAKGINPKDQRTEETWKFRRLTAQLATAKEKHSTATGHMRRATDI